MTPRHSAYRVRHWFLLMAIVSSQALSTEKIIVGYYPSWSMSAYPHTAILYQHLTHIAHAFIFPNADGTLDLTGFTPYPALIQTAKQHNVGVVIAVGGWDPERTPRFSQMAANATARQRFVAEIVNFCTTHGYAGVDMDWEYPTPNDRPNVSLLFQELRQALSAANPPMTLSLAAPATDWNNGYDWNVIAQVVDWVGVMTYDFYGSWTPKAGPNSALTGNYSATDQGWVENSVSFYRARGVPSHTLLIGIPFYGWQFHASTLYGPSTAASQIVYRNIVPLIQQGWTRHWDTTSQTPYLVNPAHNRVISYDDSISITAKVQYLKSQSLGGAIIWAIGQDFIDGQQPLLSAIGASLGTPSSTAEPVESCLPERYELNQNYPNPFNGRTTIGYQIGRKGMYSLVLFDVLGRPARTLVVQHHEPGRYVTSLESDSLPSGVYLYRLVGEGISLSKPLIVLR